MAKYMLVIEDDKEINLLLCNVLTEAGYTTTSAATGPEGIQYAIANRFDLILLDLMLPIKSGDEVLRQIRSHTDTPVIVISAKDMVRTKIDLFRIGADDYITKPFDIDEVLVRIEAVLRRYEPSTDSHTANHVLSFQDITVDCTAKRVMVSDNAVALTMTEYTILELLIKNPTKIFSKRNLFERITNEDYYSNDDALNVHMSNLRRKLGRAGGQDAYIETVYGMGYRLKQD